MKAVLALDTADRTAGAAVAVEGAVRAEIVEQAAPRQAQRILGLVEDCLHAAGVSRGDLVAVAVTRGPGAFTGLRVGLATAKGLALALGVPVVGVSTLEALARSAVPWPGWIVPVLDAKKRQVYAGAWDGLTGQAGLPEGAWPPGALAERIREAGRPAVFLGSGVEPYRPAYREILGGLYHECPPEGWAVPPGQVARIGWQAWAAGRAVAPAELVPVYHRRSEAEEARLRRKP